MRSRSAKQVNYSPHYLGVNPICLPLRRVSRTDFGTSGHLELYRHGFALHELLAEPIAKVREGEGPLFVECSTVRKYDHNGVRDDVAAGFRDAVESELFDKYCPIKLARCKFDPAKAGAIDAQVEARVAAAYRQALASGETVLEYRH